VPGDWPSVPPLPLSNLETEVHVPLRDKSAYFSVCSHMPNCRQFPDLILSSGSPRGLQGYNGACHTSREGVVTSFLLLFEGWNAGPFARLITFYVEFGGICLLQDRILLASGSENFSATAWWRVRGKSLWQFGSLSSVLGTSFHNCRFSRDTLVKLSGRVGMTLLPFSLFHQSRCCFSIMGSF